MTRPLTIAFLVLVTAVGPSQAAAAVVQVPADEQRCPAGRDLIRRADVPDDKNRNGYVCQAPGGIEASDDRPEDGLFYSRGEKYAERRRGKVGPLPGDTTETDWFDQGGPLGDFTKRMHAEVVGKGVMVLCNGNNILAGVVTPITITPEHPGSGTGGGERVLAGPDTRMCQAQHAIARSDGELYVLNRSAPVGHDSTGAVDGWRTWVTVFDGRANGNAPPSRLFDATARGAGGGTAFAIDPDGLVYIAFPPGRERGDGSIDVFPANANGNVAPIRTIYGQRGTGAPTAVAIGSGDSLYVVNGGFAAIRIYSPRAKAESAAVRLLGGSATGFIHPSSVAFDRQGRLFVADHVAGVRIFEAGATGDVEPWRVITPDRKHWWLADPRHVAVDRRGALHVLGKRGAGVYAPGAFGISEPVAMMAGDSAPSRFALDGSGRLYTLRRDTVSVFGRGRWADERASRVLAVSPGVSAMVVDRAGWLYIANADSSSIMAYAPDARGSTRPARTIAGRRTRLSRPQGLALDGHDNLYVVNSAQLLREAAVRVYAADARGYAEPVRVISGGRTGIHEVSDIAFDSRGAMYLAQRDVISVFEAGAAGDQAPARVLNASRLRVRNAMRLVIGPGDTLYVLRGFQSLGQSGPEDISVTVYPPMATGDADPVRTIEITRQHASVGRNRGFRSPTDMAVDSTGAVHVSFCAQRAEVATYAPGATGAVAPVRVVEASDSTRFAGPLGFTSRCWPGFRVIGKSLAQVKQ